MPVTEFEEYFTKIYDGSIVACEKMKKQAERLLNALHKPEKYHFDYSIANKHIRFIENFCCYPSGKKMGQPFKMELFQKARLQALFGFVDDYDLRQYNECLIIEGRKNGKTSETAAVEIDMLCNDGEGSPQIYNLATKREQATLGFTACYKMIRQSPHLRKHIRKRAADLYFDYNMGFIKALASETGSLDGLDVHCGVIDELAAIKKRDLYDLIKQAMGARSQPILFTITTNGFVRENIFDAQYEYAAKIINGIEQDEHYLPFIYELDSPDEWDKEDCWIKANPGLGTVKSFDYLRQMVNKAKGDPTFKPTVMVKDFNLKENPQNRWLRYEEAHNEELIPDYPFRYFIGGMDAADCVDLNAAKAICKRPGDDKIYVRQMYWIPQSVLDEQDKKGDRDGRDDVPYKIWISKGLMRVCPGNKVDKRVFLDWFCELRDKEDIYPLYIGYDPWHLTDDTLMKAFEQEFGRNVMIPVRQGGYTLSEPMKALKADLQANRIVYNNNPIDLWCLLNTDYKIDINNNIQPCKSDARTQRIDGTAALLDAYTVYLKKKEEYESMI